MTFYKNIKPGASRKTHLFVASLLWSVVGCGLMAKGLFWLTRADDLIFLIPALFVGIAKSFFILDRVAQKSLQRIARLKDNSCLGGVYSAKTWLLVVGMICFGIILRHVGIPTAVIGFIYMAIGFSLLLSSRKGWRQWRQT